MPSKTPDEAAADHEAKADERAAGLSDTVKSEAEGVTERVEHKQSEERAGLRSDIKNELSGVTAAIADLVEHMEQAIPEDRMVTLVDTVVEEERVSRKRLMWTVVGCLAFVIGLIGLGMLQTYNNGQTLNEAKTVADYVRECIQHPEKLTPGQQIERCGPASEGTINLIKGMLNSINCSLLISPESRTEENTAACANKAFGGSR